MPWSRSSGGAEPPALKQTLNNTASVAQRGPAREPAPLKPEGLAGSGSDTSVRSRPCERQSHIASVAQRRLAREPAPLKPEGLAGSNP